MKVVFYTVFTFPLGGGKYYTVVILKTIYLKVLENELTCEMYGEIEDGNYEDIL